MVQYYLMTAVAAVLNSFMIVFQRAYAKNEGNTLAAAMNFALINALMIIISSIVSGGIGGSVSVGVFILAIIYAACNILNLYCAANAFKYADMSTFSVFDMMGCMAIPFAAGALFFSEELNAGKIICVVLTVAAILLELDRKGVASKLAPVFYMGVFLTNGIASVLGKINNSMEWGTDPDTFFLTYGIVDASVCLVATIFMSIKRKKMFEKPVRSISVAISFGLFSAVANLLVLFSLERLDATVQYPLLTGMTIAFSAVAAFILREKLTSRRIVAALLAIAACAAVMF